MRPAASAVLTVHPCMIGRPRARSAVSGHLLRSWKSAPDANRITPARTGARPEYGIDTPRRRIEAPAAAEAAPAAAVSNESTTLEKRPQRMAPAAAAPRHAAASGTNALHIIHPAPKPAAAIPGPSSRRAARAAMKETRAAPAQNIQPPAPAHDIRFIPASNPAIPPAAKAKILTSLAPARQNRSPVATSSAPAATFKAGAFREWGGGTQSHRSRNRLRASCPHWCPPGPARRGSRHGRPLPDPSTHPRRRAWRRV